MAARHKCSRVTARGFTLVEVLVSAFIMAIGVLALVAAFGHNCVVTEQGSDVATATYLAAEIRDLALRMDFADVLALDGEHFDADTDWAQYLTVTPVSVVDLNDDEDIDAETAKAVRLTVEVRHHGTAVVTQKSDVFKMEGILFTDGG
jgi:prepilin-type N-terminal cleavage/methylation domain-containing protein